MKVTVEQLMTMEGFTTLTPIQEAILSSDWANHDLIGLSSTGSGKTHAFFMPILMELDPSLEEVQAIISLPTRELAYQVHYRLKSLCEKLGVRTRLMSGGLEKKEGGLVPHVIIGTPGRMKASLVDDNQYRLHAVKTVVVDEADMTLEFGFLEDIDQLLGRLNTKVWVFSATLPPALDPFLKRYLNQALRLDLSQEPAFKAKIEHRLIDCKHKDYAHRALDVLAAIQPYVCLIFANTNEQVSQVSRLLRQEGYPVTELHSDLAPRQRQKAIKEITQHQATYIVASDIASRGIDLEGVTHVLSCGFPMDLTYYVHRAGRTGRAGRDGVCFALATSSDQHQVQALRKMGIHFVEGDIKQGVWQEKVKPVRRQSDLAKEVAKLSRHKKVKVKPGYKKKHQAEIKKLFAKKRRQMIKEDIARQKKERAIAAQRQKREH